MQTRCPACQTLYRIDEDVLKRAGGQARCFRCDTVFDAYRNPAGEGLEAAEPLGDNEGLSDLSALTDLPEVPDASALEPDSELDLDELAANLRRYEPEPAPPADLEPAPIAQPDPAAPAPATQVIEPDADEPRLASLTDLDGLDEPPDTDPAAPPREPPPVPPRPTTTDRRRTARIAGGVLAALLVLLALAQLAWINREQVLTTPQGQALGQAACKVFDCELPPRRAPSRYAVLERNIDADPEHPGALLLQLAFRNGADFAQPLPDIQLSLYDSEQQLMARRRLHPDEYLFPAPAATSLVAPDEVVQVAVRLEDPGRHATGFKLEFL